MSVSKKIRILLIEREMKLKDLATLLNKAPSTISDKMTRGNFSENDLKEIAKVLNYDYDIVFIDKDTGKII